MAHSSSLADKNMRPWEIKSPSHSQSQATNEWPISCWESPYECPYEHSLEALSALYWHGQKGYSKSSQSFHLRKIGRKELLHMEPNPFRVPCRCLGRAEEWRMVVLLSPSLFYKFPETPLLTQYHPPYFASVSIYHMIYVSLTSYHTKWTRCWLLGWYIII